MPLRLALLGVLLAPTALAQPQPGRCRTGLATAVQDINDVRTALYNTGSLFYRERGEYLVPKASGRSAIFAGGLWVGGYVGDELRMTGTTYAQGAGFEFWPGPLREDATLPNSNDCSAFDRIWTVRRADVSDFYSTGSPTPDLAEWPVELGAPFTDHNGDGAFRLEDGDQPALYGDEVHYWVMNDVGNVHQQTGAAPLGLEVRVLAWARASQQPTLHDATFYGYEMIYRGEAPVDSLFYGLFADVSLGDYTDDHVGSSPGRGLAYAYNGDNDDSEGGGYGMNPPAVGFDLLDGAAHMAYCYNLVGPPQNCPGDGEPSWWYNYLRGRWDDGRPITYGGTGRGGTVPTPFVYPGQPGTYWSEPCINETCTDSNAPSDRRFIVSNGPFRLAPGDTLRFTLAVLWARGACAWDCADSSVDRLFTASDYVQNAYDLGALDPVPIQVPAGFIEPQDPAPSALGLGAVAPNPIREQAVIPYRVPAGGAEIRLVVYDVLGREVARLVDGPVRAGRHEAVLDASALPNGVYVYRLEVPGRVSEGRRLTVVR